MKARISLAFSPVSLVGVESSQVNQGVVFFVLMTMEEERDSGRGLTTKIGRKGSRETIRLPETGLSYPKKADQLRDCKVLHTYSRRVSVAAYLRHPVAEGVDALKWDALPTPLP